MPTQETYQLRMRARAAARRAQTLWPGPVGEVIHMELYTWQEFGYLLGGHGTLMNRLIEHIEAESRERRDPDVE